MPSTSKLLILAEEPATRDRIAEALAGPGVTIRSATGLPRAWKPIETDRPDVVVADLGSVNAGSLMDFLNRQPDPPAAVFIGPTSTPDAAGLPQGTYDYLPQCFTPEQLQAAARRAVDRHALVRESHPYYQELAAILVRLKLSQTAQVQAEKIGSLGRLVAGIAHEVNTPLGVLQSGVDTIERAAEKIAAWNAGPWGETANNLDHVLEIIRTTVEQAKAACDRIDALVTNLRQFAQLDRADFQRAHIHEGIESVIALLNHECAQGIEIVKEFGELPEIECSPRQLNQLFMNLLLNANEAIRQAGGRGAIHIRTWSEDGYVKAEVADNGVGIPAENLDKIFDPGFTTKGVQVGTGLGLPVCFQIAQAHQGRIDVESRPGKGSRFIVTLPAQRVA